MNSSEMRRFDMFTRVRDFGLTNASMFPALSLGGQSFAEINTVIETLNTQAVAQSSGLNSSQQNTEGKAAVRDALRAEMEMVTRTARGMALDTPGLDEKFRLPHSRGEQAWLTAARTFHTDAQPLKDEFIAHEMPADFLETLNALITDYEEALAAGHQSTGKHVAASAAIDKAIERGMTAARKLDSIVRNKFHNDPATLAAWASARHVERVPHKPKNPNTPPPPLPNEP
jgi:hypothetical protein